MILTITIEVEDKIEAYKIVNGPALSKIVQSAKLDEAEYVFDESQETSSTKYFLNDNFGQ